MQREIPIAPLLADAGYGNDTAFRDGISDLGLFYVVGIQSAVSVWPPGEAPLPKRKWKGIGRPTKLLRRNGQHAPMAVRELPISLPCAAWKMVRWREASGKPLRSRFAALRIRPAHRDTGTANPARKSGCSSSGRSKNQNPPSTGYLLCPPIPAFPLWYVWPNIAGSSNATTRS